MFNEQRLRNIYKGIRRRCYNKKNIFYFGRGITCEWSRYKDFRDDMLDTYLAHVESHGEKETTIERVDNSIGYSKLNCKWATWREQFNNRRTTHKITHNGLTKSTTEWAKYLGCSREILKGRLESGWSFEKSIGTPFDIDVSDYTAKSFTIHHQDGRIIHGFNLRMFCKENNLSYRCLHNVRAGKNKQHKGWVSVSTI